MATKKYNKKPKIVIIGGPTASGKSALAIRIAQEFDGEIIGADSMQIYRRMDIGTGKITPRERCGIRHRLIDIIEPNQNYSVGQYRKDAEREIAGVLNDGKLPIIAGGTGLYINALIRGYTFSNTGRNEQFRDELQKQAEEFGTQNLYDKLYLIDPVSAQKIMPGDLRRIIRALEVCEFSDRIKSEQIDDKEDGQYDYLLLLIKTDREKLYNSINSRVDQMLASGLVQEVQSLGLTLECGSMNAIGYKETLSYLNSVSNVKDNVEVGGEFKDAFSEGLDGRFKNKLNRKITNFGELSEAIKINTRHYAKRQITYFKNVFKNSEWVLVDDFEYISERIACFLKE